MHCCRNPTLREVWGHHSHSWKWDLGVLGDSWKLIIRLQGSEHLKSRESKPEQFRDSTLGVQGKNVIRMQIRRRDTKNTIWGKVVASPEFGPWWVKWVQGCPWLVLTPRVCRMSSNQLVGWFWMQDQITK